MEKRKRDNELREKERHHNEQRAGGHHGDEHHGREHQEKDHQGEEHHGRGEGSDDDGKEREVHLEMLRRRWLGSAPPTAEAYARALKQWRQLPGSIATATTDVEATRRPADLDGSNPRA